jgi:hypothetical protein
MSTQRENWGMRKSVTVWKQVAQNLSWGYEQACSSTTQLGQDAVKTEAWSSNYEFRTNEMFLVHVSTTATSRHTQTFQDLS